MVLYIAGRTRGKDSVKRAVWQYLTEPRMLLHPLHLPTRTYLEDTPPITRTFMCTELFMAASFVITKCWKLPEHPSTGDQLNQLWCIHSMEYYAAVKNEGNHCELL